MTRVCASLCRALLLASVLGGCGEVSETSTDHPGAGGATASGGTTGNATTGGVAGADVTGGTTASGGHGGSAGENNAGAGASDCGAEVTTPLAEYCAQNDDFCHLTDAVRCEVIWFGTVWTRGCGYLKAEYWGDVGDRAIDIWDETTNELVYRWYNGKQSVGCVPPWTVGTLPECADWQGACIVR